MSMHADVCKDLCEQVWDDPTFLLQIITKSYGYNSDTRQQFSQWKTFQCPRPKKGRLVSSVTMNMLLVFSEKFFTCTFFHRGQILNAEFCCNILSENIWCKQPELWCDHSRVPLHCRVCMTESTLATPTQPSLCLLYSEI